MNSLRQFSNITRSIKFSCKLFAQISVSLKILVCEAVKKLFFRQQIIPSCDERKLPRGGTIGNKT